MMQSPPSSCPGHAHRDWAPTHAFGSPGPGPSGGLPSPARDSPAQVLPNKALNESESLARVAAIDPAPPFPHFLPCAPGPGLFEAAASLTIRASMSRCRGRPDSDGTGSRASPRPRRRLSRLTRRRRRPGGEVVRGDGDVHTRGRRGASRGGAGFEPRSSHRMYDGDRILVFHTIRTGGSKPSHTNKTPKLLGPGTPTQRPGQQILGRG
jgi:hypothetical protein